MMKSDCVLECAPDELQPIIEKLNAPADLYVVAAETTRSRY